MDKIPTIVTRARTTRPERGSTSRGAGKTRSTAGRRPGNGGNGRQPASNPAPQPTFTRLKASIELTPPAGHIATVLLKEVDRDDAHRYYAIWLMVGRSGDDANSVPYKHMGADIIRCDVPEGMVMSPDALQPAFQAFWAAEPVKDDGTVIIRGSGGGSSGSGGQH